jgi:hypothetical protein
MSVSSIWGFPNICSIVFLMLSSFSIHLSGDSSFCNLLEVTSLSNCFNIAPVCGSNLAFNLVQTKDALPLGNSIVFALWTILNAFASEHVRVKALYALSFADILCSSVFWSKHHCCPHPIFNLHLVVFFDPTMIS